MAKMYGTAKPDMIVRLYIFASFLTVLCVYVYIYIYATSVCLP